MIGELGELKRKLFLIMGGLLLSIMIAVTLFGFWGIRAERAQMQEEENRQTALYLETAEESFDEMERFVVAESELDDILTRILSPGNELEYYLALLDKEEHFEEKAESYRYLGGVFLYDSSVGRYVGTEGHGGTADDSSCVQEHISDIIDINEQNWSWLTLDEQPYLFLLTKKRTVSLGIWLKPETFLDAVAGSYADETEFYALADGKGRLFAKDPLISSVSPAENRVRIEGNDWRMAAAYSEKYQIYLLHFARDTVGEALFYRVFFILLLILLIGLVAWRLLSGLLRDSVLSPMDAIFLKKENERNKAELQYLQLQLKPHFLTNCLSLIRNLILAGRREDAERAALVLGKYIRYSLTPRVAIPLREELEHVRLYYELQKMRYGDTIALRISAAEDLMEEEIPAMLIQSFVDNAVKHELARGRILHIRVDIFAGEAGMVCQILDDGEGFSPDVLTKLRAAIPIVDEDGMAHIGICNIVQRLHILYGDRAAITFANGSPDGKAGGALIRITLPVGGARPEEGLETRETSDRGHR